MIMKRLREETGELHAALEQQLPLINPLLSRDDYGRILEGFYGYYAPLEAQLAALEIWEEIAFDFSARRKSPRLRIDLLTLGRAAVTLPLIPQCSRLPRLDSIQSVLGCLYVMEGATLGGQIITRHLTANLGITSESGGGFFAGYEAETGARWKGFGVMIRAAEARFGGADQIVDSANLTFATLSAWLLSPRS